MTMSAGTHSNTEQNAAPPKSTAPILWTIIAVSLGVHVACLILGRTTYKGWICPHEPVHAAVEISGGMIALWVAWMLLALERRKAGTSFNVWIAGALIGMGILDCLHAVVHVGQAFVWLHSTATFVGGLLFACVWLPSRWARGAAKWWPMTVAVTTLVFGTWSLLNPDRTPDMLVTDDAGTQHFSTWAQALNVVGGLLLFVAAVRIIQQYLRTKNLDDLLFCLHCALFGAAAIMFEQSQLWDLPWWGWHVLRLLAYAVAMWFVVRTEQQNQTVMIAMTERLQHFNRELESRVTARTEELAGVNAALARTNEELKTSDQRMHLVFESASNGMLLVNGSGEIVLVNAQLESLFGYPRDDLIGRSVDVLVPPAYREQHPALRQRFFERPVTTTLGAGRDLKGSHRDGHEIFVEIGLTPITMDGHIFALASIADVTERKLHEAETVRHSEELEVANQALEQSNLDLQQFAYVASHDLQTPLRSIAGFAQFLHEDYSEKLDTEAQEYIGYIIDGATRMQTLIRDLLTWSRVETRAKAFEPTDMNDVFDEIAAMLTPELESGASLTRDNLPTVQGDASQLTHLLQNLIGNGLKYARDEIPPAVHVAVDESPDEWVFSVRDNGIGIEAKHHDRIFEIFSRLHTQRDYPGTGIGLAVCRRVVQRHDGNIWLESEPGTGSVFHFSIPRGTLSGKA